MKRSWLLFIIFFFLFSFNQIYAQGTSNKGKDFYVPYSAHYDALNSKLTLILSADVQTNYSISIGNTVIATGSIAANTSQQQIINPNSYNVYIASTETKEVNKAIHVTTDKAISLYTIMSYNARTGGSMILPTNTLGKDYYAFSYQNFGASIGYSQFTVLATKDDTDIDIIPTQTSRSGAHTAKTKFTIKLNKGDIYQYQSLSDLSGSYISSIGDCKPIAVFSGSTWTAFCEAGKQGTPSGGDNLYQQIFPISAWGKNFVTAPFYNTLHGNTDAFRIIVSDDNTTITVNGSTTNANGTTLNNPYAKGSVITFFSTGPNLVSGTKPIALAHYQTSQNCNLNNSPNVNYPGDPEITLLNPVEQTLNDITVFSKLNSLNLQTNINSYYINVIIKTADVATFKMDGISYTSSFVPIAGSIYSYAIINVTNLQAQHRLTSDGGFSAIAYGYGSFESYAYLAGANVQNFTFQVRDATDQIINSGCINETLKPRINLAEPALQLVWKLGGIYTKTIDNPVPEITVKDGVTYYTYIYPDEITFTTPAPDGYIFNVNVTYLNTTNCGNTEDFSSTFKVFDLPKTAFDLPEKVCLGDEISPIDKSTVSDSQITKWEWTFDGKKITDQKPKYAFTTEGEHIVTLSVGTQNGCWSEILSQRIIVNPVPVSKFKAVSKTCINADVLFTDQSTINSTIIPTAKIEKWHWDFGDGTPPIDLSSGAPFPYKFTVPKKYTVKLTTTSNNGCVSEVFPFDIEVSDLPKADFTMPNVCLNDAFALFTNTSVDAADATNVLTYAWDFGDPDATLANPNTSVEINGSHRYIKAGTYTVTLKITNSNGCTSSETKSFTVNGAVEKAGFTVQNEQSLCSNEDVVINNTSSVFFGKVTKILIYKDFINAPADFETVLYPTNEDIHLKYASFGGTENKPVTIRLYAYSGEACFSFIDKVIMLKPSPQLEFAEIIPVCQNDGSVIINQANQIPEEAMPGTGVYSGRGMDNNGNFNPRIAGVGTHVITYTFTADNGCTDFITQTVVVKESPLADTEHIIYILAGGETVLPATASGPIISYQWLPATGLNKNNILNPIASPDKDTDYTLTVTTGELCTAVATVTVRVLQAIDPPNSFTPNGDGVNDVWNIKHLSSYPKATVEVFNRNGNRVFFSKGYTVPFDGTYMNEPLPVGVYYYIISPGNGRKATTGPLTIIR